MSGILVGLIAAIGAVGVLLMRLSMAAKATSEIAEAANDIGNLARRWRWRRRLASSSLDHVDDPRLAAVVMMLATAEADGALTERERNTILDISTTTFCATPAQAEELFALGRWIARDARDIDRVFKRMATVIVKRCAPGECTDVLDMVRRVAEADGVSQIHRDVALTDAIVRLERMLKS